MTATKYTTLFFDLDHTLWDYERNSRDTLEELYTQYDLASKGVYAVAPFQDQFRKVNIELWDLYDRELITSDTIREERFKRILAHFGAYHPKLSDDLSHDYLDQCPKKGNLMPFAIETLTYLKSKSYNLTVITNGFEEIQHRKLSSSNLHGYFDHIVTSQKAGHRKPSKEIFQFALRHHGAACHEAMMIGDNLITDIGGSRNASIDNVFYNWESITHDGTPDYEIHCLSELNRIL
jgi:YjjG family noncanonical pyrimidine nucleotidase